ncbi:conserved hypothetical protein [Ricinus communis]|uniref:Uncharacterized protein n=1 Tax=Ricinus communis TaxID=3988 RepID=B9TAR8_RICCO|nr:conserved hypothetical protein [Ricinus communis]
MERSPHAMHEEWNTYPFLSRFCEARATASLKEKLPLLLKARVKRRVANAAPQSNYQTYPCGGA